MWLTRSSCSIQPTSRSAEGSGSDIGHDSHRAREAVSSPCGRGVWEAQEQLKPFGATLMPVLSAAGVDPGKPMVAALHNVIG